MRRAREFAARARNDGVVHNFRRTHDLRPRHNGREENENSCILPSHIGHHSVYARDPRSVSPQRCKFSLEGGTEEASYPQQLRLDVGDTPGHIIGAYEVRRGPTPSAKPNCEGFKVVERLTHGFLDTIDRNGRVGGYGTITLDNGDKIYTEYSGSVSAVTGADGSLMSVTNAISTWTGGTGRYLGVRGVTRDKSETFYVKDSQGKLNAKTNKLSSEGEYWFEK